MDPTKEKTVGCVLAGGALVSFCSLPLMWVFALAGVFRGTMTREPGTDRLRDAGTLNYISLSTLR